ncbi:cytochrome P450 [Haloarcula onubensis]|uniref:Cytochrome P450 n=1 Tax=Haloarcula onubensis TaxID=2950539 RepID=A0ABU2FRM5_9EURY|nr:cytochrome P450 [Halomicroarcula sp. S3CR25-11]MDS0283426.1 cytochrome P450 [Halomicroarcula sp. S3CR25-11]
MATQEVNHPGPVTPDDEPPRPGRVPVLDNTLSMLRDPLAFYDRVGAMDADVVGYNVAGTTGYFVTHPDLVERILVTDEGSYEKGALLQRSLGEYIGEGLFLLEGEEWKEQRTALQPAFYREKIAAYGESMTDFAAATGDGWTDGERVDVLPEMREYTLRVLGKTLLDVDIDRTADALEPLLSALRERLDPRSLSAYVPLSVPTPTNRRVRSARANFEATLDDIIAERRAESAADREARDDVLSLLLSLDDETMSRKRLGHQLLTFLVAGHDTTALTLTYAWFLLGRHPERQRKLHEELDSVLGDADPTPEDLFELPYLDDVLTEVLRLYPPAFTTFRQPTRPVTLGGYDIAPDAQLTIPQWLVHRDERWYDDPDAFRPERWTDSFEAQLPDYAYYPFGGGPRHCIGMRFARMEAKLAIATLAGRYRFETVTEPPLDLAMRITLSPTEAVDVRVHER